MKYQSKRRCSSLVRAEKIAKAPCRGIITFPVPAVCCRCCAQVQQEGHVLVVVGDSSLSSSHPRPRPLYFPPPLVPSRTLLLSPAASAPSHNLKTTEQRVCLVHCFEPAVTMVPSTRAPPKSCLLPCALPSTVSKNPLFAPVVVVVLAAECLGGYPRERAGLS